MASQKTKFAVGLFVASGIGIALMAIVWLGMSRYLEKGHFFTAYFNESVQGLSKDAPVKYRGVPIGRVEKIRVAPDSNLIEVIMMIETGQTLDRSYVAQLKDVGITGSMFVELDRKKPDEPDLSPHISFPSEYPIVASKPAELSQLLGELNSVFSHIKSLDLEGISEKVKLTLDTMNGMMAEADVKGISEKLKSTLEGADRLMARERWDHILASIDQAARSINGLVYRTDRTMKQANQTLAGAERLLTRNEKEVDQALEGLVMAVENVNILLEKGASFISRTDDSAVQLRRQLSVSAQNLEKATDNLNQFLELLADHPSQLVFGEPPAERIMAPEKN
jgi:phospholipid/cholesterol/gamma-HCH transport system substrate-binding protein